MAKMVHTGLVKCPNARPCLPGHALAGQARLIPSKYGFAVPFGSNERGSIAHKLQLDALKQQQPQSKPTCSNASLALCSFATSSWPAACASMAAMVSCAFLMEAWLSRC